MTADVKVEAAVQTPVQEPVQQPVQQAPAQTTAQPEAKPTVDTAWRERLSGGNKDYMKVMERYNTETDYIKSTFELRQKLSSGEYKRNVPPPSDPNDLAAWRKDNGLPETVDKYELKFKDGFVLGEQDKPFVDQFKQKMFDANISPEHASKAVNAYYEMQEATAAQLKEDERAYAVLTEEKLREEWGSEYRFNYNMTENFVKSRFEAPVAEAIMKAGPEVIKAVAGIAREIYPAMTVVPNSSNPSQAISDEIKSLEARIGTPEWFADSAAQNRYKQLIAAREGMR